MEFEISPALNSSQPAGSENQRASRPAARRARLGTSSRKGIVFSVGAMFRLIGLNVLAAGPSEKGLLPATFPHGGTVLNMISCPAFKCPIAATVLQETVHDRA